MSPVLLLVRLEKHDGNSSSGVWSCLWGYTHFHQYVHHRSGFIAKWFILITLPVCDMLVLPLLSCESIASFPYAESGGTAKLVWYTTARLFHPATAQTEREKDRKKPGLISHRHPRDVNMSAPRASTDTCN